MELEDRVRYYFEVGLSDQCAEWFDAGGDVDTRAMASDAIVAFELGRNETAMILRLARELTEWWNGLGIEFVGSESPTEEEMDAMYRSYGFK